MANSQTTSFRSIDIPATGEYNYIQQWFFTPELMSQFLCALKLSVYVHRDGTIRDQDGETIGKWYYVELNTPHNEDDLKNLENPGSGVVQGLPLYDLDDNYSDYWPDK